VHVTDQSTPRFSGSLETVALIIAVALICMDVGGATVKTMETAGLIVTVAETVIDGSAVALAVMVTVPPVGTVGGAMYDVGAPLAV
jgi:hypothetical protein